MSERISVIVPVHNGQGYIAACIESIAGQTYSALEILIVNDGSTDDTQTVCEELAERYRDRDIRIFNLSDKGVSATRNYALEQAKGAYFMFVDADDRLMPDMVERLYRALMTTKSDIAGCRFRVWHTEEELGAARAERRRNARNSEEVQESAEYTEYDSRHFLTDSILMDNCRCWSKLYRREAVGEVRFRTEYTIGEDMLYLVDIQPYVGKVVEVDYEGYCYYQNPHGAMKRPFTRRHMDQISCWELARELILSKEPELAERVTAKVLTAIMLTVGKIAVLPRGKRREAREYLDVCHKKIKEESQAGGAFAYLPNGYGVKIKFFRSFPKGYLFLYHLLQSVKQ